MILSDLSNGIWFEKIRIMVLADQSEQEFALWDDSFRRIDLVHVCDKRTDRRKHTRTERL